MSSAPSPLRPDGFGRDHTETTENGTDRSGQALDLAEEVKPDLVLLDAVLPDG